MTNSFAKFREYLKIIKKEYIEVLENYQKSIDMGYSALELFNEKNKRKLPKNIARSIDLLYQKLNIKTVHEEVKTIEDFIDNLKEDIRYTKEMIKKITNLINSFDNDGCIKKIDSIKTLTYFLVNALSDITFDDAQKIVGAAIYYNAKLTNDINYKTLQTCFNRDGSFKLGCQVYDFYKAINKVYESSAVINFDDLANNNNKAREIINYIIRTYNKFYIEKLLEKPKKHDEPKQTKNYSKEVSIESKNIISSEENDFKELFSETELDIIHISSKMLENMSNNEYYYDLLNILTDINAIKSLWPEATEEERKDLMVLKNEYMESLRDITNNIEEVKEATNNLIFLNDGDNNCYFVSDFENIDKGLRSSVLKLLGKITPDNAKNFRPIKSNIYKITDLYEVFNGTGHIMFKLIGNGIYLVIGAGIRTDDYYAKLVRRVMDPFNKKYIEELLIELSDEENRSKILLSQEEFRNNIVEGIKKSR